MITKTTQTTATTIVLYGRPQNVNRPTCMQSEIPICVHHRNNRKTIHEENFDNLFLHLTSSNRPPQNIFSPTIFVYNEQTK